MSLTLRESDLVICFLVITLFLPRPSTHLVMTPAPTISMAGIVYYVDWANGSDSNPGTSQGQAWRTIQKAADTMVAGDYCIVLAGEYDERVYVTTSGSPGAPITYWAEDTVTMKGFTVRADYIAIKGFEITDTNNKWDDGVGIFIEGSHCVIENNYIHFATRSGISIFADPPDAPTTSDCIVRNNRLYRNTMAGVEIAGKNHLIEDNEIWRTIQHHPKWADPPSWVDADGMRFLGSGHIIRGNYIHDIRMDDPENVDPHIDCFQTWGPAYNIVFERNFCENLDENMQGFMIEEQNAPVRNLTIKNNIFQAFAPLNIFDCENVIIVNNTFASDLSPNQWGIELTNSPSATIKNNIFFDICGQHLKIDEASRQGLDVGYNSVFRSDGQPLLGSPSLHDLWNVDPMFVDAAGGDFHLRADSPCIDAGTNVDVAEDFDGNPRPQGAGFDTGAFEYTEDNPSLSEFIIDDADASFSTSFTQDPWREYIEPDGEHYGDTYYYNSQTGSGEDVAFWSFSVPQPGQYDVYAWWCGGSQRPTDVPYTVNHLGGSTAVRVNQQTGGGQWNLLGPFNFLSQGSVVVSDDASSGQDVVADAIKIVYSGPLPPGTLRYVYLPLIVRWISPG